jgi:tetratricopeptide (TPR) repeat protein
MSPRRLQAALVLVACLAGAPAAAETPRELRDRAAEFAYNLDHDESMRLLREAVALDPNDSATHRAIASSVWLDILFERGAVTVDHYLGGVSRSMIKVKKPAPELDAQFRAEIASAIELAQKEVDARPNDPQAHYDLGTALGLEASYIASVEGRLLAGLRAARRSFDEQERVLRLDPSRKEAGLIVGTYRYVVSTLSLPMRLMAYMAGFGGGRERGLRLIEESAATPSEDQTDALFALVLLYNREKRYDDALQVLDRLHRRYPRNRLVVLEAGATAVRAGRGAEADALLTKGIDMFARDSRRKVPGEAGLWHYKRGAARVLLGRPADARSDLQIALGPDSLVWVQGRAHLELGRLALQEGNGAAARAEAARAIAACETGSDPLCVEQSKRLVK